MVLGGCRSFLLLVTTGSAHELKISFASGMPGVLRKRRPKTRNAGANSCELASSARGLV